MENHGKLDLMAQARELLRTAESAELPADPTFLVKYAGEWVVIDQGQVVAHGQNGVEVAQIASVIKYPHSVLYYVPTLEEQSGVRVFVGPLGFFRASRRDFRGAREEAVSPFPEPVRFT
jgi:hypothetical protein